jgi:RNA polymerase sigma factor (sigma-70 family)
MTNDYIPDIELLQLLRSEDPTAWESAFKQLLEDPSVQARMEVLLAESDGQKSMVDYLKLRAFNVLKNKVNTNDFKQEGRLVVMYVKYVDNLFEIDCIKNQKQPHYDRILMELYNDKTVIRSIVGKISRHQHLDVYDILDTAIVKLFEAIDIDRFRGESSLKTYLTRICSNLILNTFKEVKTNDTFDEKEANFLEKANKYEEPLGFLGDEFRLGTEERNATKDLFNKYVNRVFNQITEICREVLVLEHIEERSKAEIMAIMNIALSTAKNQKSRCKEQFEKAIKAISGLKEFFKENYGKY